MFADYGYLMEHCTVVSSMPVQEFSSWLSRCLNPKIKKDTVNEFEQLPGEDSLWIGLIKEINWQPQATMQHVASSHWLHSSGGLSI
jgi:hypothetical protein